MKYAEIKERLTGNCWNYLKDEPHPRKTFGGITPKQFDKLIEEGLIKPEKVTYANSATKWQMVTETWYIVAK